MLEGGGWGGFSPPGILGFRNENRKRNRGIITTSPPQNQNPNVVLEVRRMRSNLSYLLKSFLLYQQTFWLFWCEYLRFQVKNIYSLVWNTELKLPELLDFPFGNSTQSHSFACIFCGERNFYCKKGVMHILLQQFAKLKTIASYIHCKCLQGFTGGL